MAKAKKSVFGKEFTSYSVENDKKFFKALDETIAQVEDLRVPLKLITKDFYKSEKAIFKLKSSGEYPDFKNGGKDSPYAKWKQKKFGFTYPLLKRTGKLERSVTNPTDLNAINYLVGKQLLVIGSKVDYLVFHQSDAPRSKIPLRKVLFVGPESIKWARDGEITGRLSRWLDILREHTLSIAEKKLAEGGT